MMDCNAEILIKNARAAQKEEQLQRDTEFLERAADSIVKFGYKRGWFSTRSEFSHYIRLARRNGFRAKLLKIERISYGKLVINWHQYEIRYPQ